MPELKGHKSNHPFIVKLTQLVRDNFTNEQFGVEVLADKSGVSRAHLYKKIKKLTGKSASQFIREIRLEEAYRQLVSKKYSVSEVAFNVGFSSAAYFTTSFKEYFGYSPSEVNRLKNDFNETDSIKSIESQSKLQSVPKWIVITAVLLIVITSSIIVTSSFSNSRVIKDKTIAVIRFDNMTNDETQQVFADGLGEEIINSLCKLKALKVSARNSSFQFNKEDDLKQISKVLGVNYLLEGSVRKQDDRYRITIQLIDTSDGYHLWSQNFDSKKEDILTLQEEIARIVAHNLRIELSPYEEKVLAQRSTTDSLAYSYYRAGVNLENASQSEDREKGIRLINKAIKVDSNFALAHAKIVSLYKWSSYVGDTSYDQALELMNYHVNKALELDPNLAESYIAKGQLDVFKEDYESALNSFQSAIALEPNNSRANFAMAYPLRYLNRTREGYDAWLKAFAIDPLKPEIALMTAQYFYFVERDFEKGRTILQNFIDAFPDTGFHWYHLQMYKASLPDGNIVEAFKNYFHDYKKHPNDPNYWLIKTSLSLDLIPFNDMIINKVRLLYPNRTPTFWHVYNNNAINKKFQENVDLVNYWMNIGQLTNLQFANFVAESYIKIGRPEMAIEVIENSIQDLLEPDFLNNAENFDPYLINRLDVLEKYIIALRQLDQNERADRFANQVDLYISSELERLEASQALDYRRAFDLQLQRASVNDDVDEYLSILEQAYFQDNYLSELFYRQPKSFARSYRFENNLKFQEYQKRFKDKIHEQRAEVIQFLKEEGAWQEHWDQRL